MLSKCRSLSAFERARLRNVCSEWNRVFATSAPSMDFKAALFEAHRVTFNEATSNHSFQYYRFCFDKSAASWRGALRISPPEALAFFIRGVRSISNVFIQTDHIQFKLNPTNLMSFVQQRLWNAETLDIWMGNSLDAKTLAEFIAPFIGALQKLNVLYMGKFVAPTNTGKRSDYKQLAATINGATRLQRLRLPAHYVSDNAELPVAQSDLYLITINVLYIPSDRTVVDVCFPNGLLDILPHNITKLEIDVGSRAFLIRQEHEERELVNEINSRLQTLFHSHLEQVPRRIDLHLCSGLPTTHRRNFRDAVLGTTVNVIIRSFDS
uniref:F-box domain-containing protein n=1 Tax=Parascaris univalens TaxID=6257 RepID=A0A915ALN8_PARUN